MFPDFAAFVPPGARPSLRHTIFLLASLEFQSPSAVLFPEWDFELPRACLYESRLYLVRPLNPFLFSTSSCYEGRLIVVEYDSGRLRLSDPFMGCLYHHKPTTLSFLNCRTVELGKAYTFRLLGTSSIPGSMGNKVVMSASPDESAAFLILYLGKLAFAREGNEKLIVIDDREYHHDYIIVYNGQFYSVDKRGILWWIENSSLNMVEFSSPHYSLFSLAVEKKNYLVESCGSLYLVHAKLGWREDHRRKKDHRSKTDHRSELDVWSVNEQEVVDLKVYKLDEECHQWVPISNLGDHAFFLRSDYSFSILASELIRCENNCIYLLEQDDTVVIFDMEDATFYI